MFKLDQIRRWENAFNEQTEIIKNNEAEQKACGSKYKREKRKAKYYK